MSRWWKVWTVVYAAGRLVWAAYDALKDIREMWEKGQPEDEE